MRQWKNIMNSKRLLSFGLGLVLVLMLLTPLENVKAANFSGYIAISSWEDLADIVNDPTAKYYLAKDVNMEGSGDWVPIENFTGILDGNGKTISNLYSSRGGLFANLKGEDGNRVIVRNLTLKDVDLAGASVWQGAIANQAFMTDIINCKVSGNIKVEGVYHNSNDPQNPHTYEIGGLVGYSKNCIFKKCVNQGNISGKVEFRSEGQYERYYSESVYVGGNFYSGGITGKTEDSELIECYNAGIISCQTSYTLLKSSMFYSVSRIAFGRISVGGIAGAIQGDKNTIQECVNISGGLEAKAGAWISTELVYDYGHHQFERKDIFCSIGGLIGCAVEDSNVKLINSYFPGTGLSAADYPNIAIGGAVGTANSCVQFDSVYYLKDEMSNINASLAGVGDKDTNSVKAYNTRGLKKQNNYKGWDFKNVWAFNSDVNNGMPVLRCAEFLYQLSTPVASEANGTYRKGTKIELTVPAEGAKIYYTTNGKTPTTKSKRYTEPIVLDQAMKIRAIAVLDDFQQSEVMKADYKLKPSNEVMMSKEKATISLDSTLKLKVLNLDSSKVSKQKWSANRKTIAKVDQNGVVTPVAIGKTTIKCKITYKDGKEVVVSCLITVTE